MSDPALKLCALTKRFAGDERGVASIIAAMLMLLGLGLSVLTIDVGHLYLAKRRLQGAVDAAALAAAGDPVNAAAIAARVLAANGYAQTATVATGAYTPDPSLPVAGRLDTNPSAQKNAVRVTETISTTGFLAGVSGGAMLSNIVATATATQAPTVSFSAGTGLASLSNGQLNAVLGGLLNRGGASPLSLSLLNYQALASTNVDALTFLDQLAAQAGVSAGTYGDLANTNITIGQMTAATRAALIIHPNGNNSAALDALNLIGLQAPAAASGQVSNIVDTTVWQKRQVGSIVQQTPGQVTFNLFDMITAMSRVYGAGHVVTMASGISVPITNSAVTTRLALGSPMTSIALARVGTSISTAQARLALTTTVANVNLGVATVAVTLPIYLSLASGTATVATIPCQTGGTMTRISAAAQAANVQIGVVSDTDISDFSKNPTVQPATVANVNVSIFGLGLVAVAITASSSLAAASGSSTNLDFTQNDIDTGAVKEASGSNAGSIISGLAPGLTFGFSPNSLGVGTIISGTVLPLLKPMLINILQKLDAPTDTLLRSLGLRLGAIDVVVHGVRCGTPALVT